MHSSPWKLELISQSNRCKRLHYAEVTWEQKILICNQVLIGAKTELMMVKQETIAPSSRFSLHKEMIHNSCPTAEGMRTKRERIQRRDQVDMGGKRATCTNKVCVSVCTCAEAGVVHVWSLSSNTLVCLRMRVQAVWQRSRRVKLWLRWQRACESS